MTQVAKRFVWILVASLPLVFLYFLRKEYLGDPNTDFGFELYLGKRILESPNYFPSIFYSMGGPLGPHLLALWFGLFGASRESFVELNFLLLIFFQSAMFCVLYSVFGGLRSFIFTIILALLFFFNQTTPGSNFSFLVPYRLNGTLALFLSVASLYCLWASFRDKRMATISGIFAPFLFFSKPEIFLATIVTTISFFCLSIWYWRDPSSSAKSILLKFFLGLFFGILTLATIFGFLWNGIEFQVLVNPYLSLFRGLSGESQFYRKVMGLSDPDLFFNFFLSGISFLFVVIPIWYLRRFKEAKNVELFWGLLALGILVGSSLFPEVAKRSILWQLLSPTICILFVLFAARKREPSFLEKGAFLWALWAGLMSARVFFANLSIGYGFLYALPSCAFVLFLLIKAPDILQLSVKRAKLWAVYILMLFIPQAGQHWLVTSNLLNQKTMKVGWPRMEFYYYPRVGLPMFELGQYLMKNSHQFQTLATFPDGAVFNFSLSKEQPFPFLSLMPDQVAYLGEKFILDHIRSIPCDWIVIYPIPMGEFGVGSFEAGYGQQLFKELASRYNERTDLPESLIRAGVKIFEKR